MKANYTEYITGKFSSNTSPFGTNGSIFNQDLVSNNIVNIDQVHHQIHKGRHFQFTDITEDVQSATPKRYLLISPNTTTRIHLVYRLESFPGALVQLYEGTTVSANGSQLSTPNSNRNSLNTAELLAYEDPTVTGDGTLLFSDQEGSTTTGGGVPSQVQHDDEVILKQNTRYQLKITVLANNTDTSIHVDWYEVV